MRRRHELLVSPSCCLIGLVLLSPCLLELSGKRRQIRLKVDYIWSKMNEFTLKMHLYTFICKTEGVVPIYFIIATAPTTSAQFATSPRCKMHILIPPINGTYREAYFIVRLKKVYTLNVVGQIPAELQNLTYLTNLDLAQNYLTGSLPAFLGKLTRLQYLSLVINALTGVLPKELGNLKNLVALGISANKFVSPLPVVENLTKLEQLLSVRLRQVTSNILLRHDRPYIDSCGLSGELPSTFSKLKNLKTLWASDNEFTGKIPDYIGSLSNLTDLDLSFNIITGKVSPALLNLNRLNFLDLSYNILLGRYPSWVNNNNLQVILPSGLNCLQRDTPCFGSPSYSSFAVDSGGSRPIRASDNSIYEPDDASLQLASYYVTNSTRWGVSNIGRPMDSMNESYIVYTSRRFTNTLDSELFQTARMSPSSLRYYGIGLKNGMYNVVLQFAEIYFPDDQTWISLGKRIFNIYVQVNIFLNILTNGRSYTVVQKQYIVEVTNNFIDIHLFWAGKGTCCIPIQGFYGPSISALSVSSYGVPGPQKSKTSKIGLVVGVVVCVAVLGFLALAWAFVWRQKRRKLEMEMEELFSIVGRPNVFSYGEIKSATDSFSPANILGRGGYGLVYKGKLLDGRMVAVKQLSSTSHQGKKEFMTEIATISTVQHRNLVKLHGCCIDSKTPLLVYEYLEQGSLNQAILGKIDLNLDWRTRFEICVGIARGLAYLHEESSMRIVHRDIKASNVLLDADLNPKISDFGLSRHYKDSMTHLNTGVAGTLGYLAPEYAMMGHLTEKADVFAFGVVALEIIAVRRNFDDCLEEDEKYLLGCAWHLQESHRTLELLDSKVAEFDEEEAARLINVALLCTMGLPQRRPAMSKVVAMLTEDIEMTDGRGQHHEA
ncbi:hypothetical protein CFC21_043502 [Triticum aestivum]|uniref:non-specific serine/threonine protein kinase n=2 Tax=Triticum aestivum TaxID=4565 RepID=A0A3B6FY90_WHEAT|nr:hypothetical protein CFC21_043502 [Triticum aestivum]